METLRDRRPAAASTLRHRPHAPARCAGALLAIAVVLAMLAVQLDVYGAFADGGMPRFDGSTLRKLLAGVGLDRASAAR